MLILLTILLVALVLFLVSMWSGTRPSLGFFAEGVSWGLVSSFLMYAFFMIESTFNPEFIARFFETGHPGAFREVPISPGSIMIATAFLLGLQQRVTRIPEGGLILTWISGLFGTFFALVGLLAPTWDLTRVALEAILFSVIVEYGHLWVFPKRKVEA